MSVLKMIKMPYNVEFAMNLFCRMATDRYLGSYSNVQDLVRFSTRDRDG